MEREKRMIPAVNFILKENIWKVKSGMEKEKNIFFILNLIMKENFYAENCMEKEKNIIMEVIWYLKVKYFDGKRWEGKKYDINGNRIKEINWSLKIINYLID